MKDLFCFGFGYTARFLAHLLRDKGWTVTGTARTPDGVREIEKLGYNGVQFNGLETAAPVSEALKTATHVLISAGPGANGDPVLAHHRHDLNASRLRWVGYLSTVGVYGDWNGQWVDEDSLIKPKSQRSRFRANAEKDWLLLEQSENLAVHVFRLAGIYGPQRNTFAKLREGVARRIVKQGQVFNRIHVEDIAQVLDASMRKPNPGSIYNVADDKPCPPQEVIAYASSLMGVSPPPLVAFEDADLTPMARSFYGENKRVSNGKVKQELGVSLNFPTYKEGLSDLFEKYERN